MNGALGFLSLSPQRRALAFGQTAAAMAVSSVMVEKDFRVCWLLALLFADTELAPHVVFKGGTSLSKVYGVIDRFSEDIDLSQSPAFVGTKPPSRRSRAAHGATLRWRACRRSAASARATRWRRGWSPRSRRSSAGETTARTG